MIEKVPVRLWHMSEQALLDPQETISVSRGIHNHQATWIFVYIMGSQHYDYDPFALYPFCIIYKKRGTIGSFIYRP